MLDENSWALGIFEGEGCISIRKTGRVELLMAMTDEDIVRRFHTATQVGNVNGPYTNGLDKNNNPYTLRYSWNCTRNQDIIYLLEKWISYFGARRQLKASEALLILSSKKRYNS